jgi:hypothetical protein
MTEEEIQARIKARLKEEGIESDEDRPASRAQRARPPARIDESIVKAQSEEPKNPAEEGGRERIDSVFDAIDAEERRTKDETKNNETLTPKQAIATAGALTGAALKLKSEPGKGVFQPKPTSENARVVGEISEDIVSRQKALDKIDEQIRNIIKDPNATSADFTPDQVQRILQGGEGPTAGTTGAQRGYGYNAEQQRRARHQAQTEGVVSRINPYLPDPIVQAGQVVPLPSGIQVPTNVATELAQAKAKAQAEAQRRNLELQRQSEQNKINIGKENINKEMKLAQSRGYRAGAGKVAVGALGGAETGLSAYDIYQKWKSGQPIDWQDWSRLAGGLGMTFGGTRLGTAGALATIPWAIKHKDELMREMTLGDINPTAFSAQDTLTPAVPEMQNRR